nr:hypothetical protein [Frankia sp. QA3]
MATAARSDRMSGASKTSSSNAPAPRSSPARSASSTKAVPGTSTLPCTVWSASQGWVASESRPENSTPSWSASPMTAPSSGWSALARPSPATLCPPVDASRSQ